MRFSHRDLLGFTVIVVAAILFLRWTYIAVAIWQLQWHDQELSWQTSIAPSVIGKYGWSTMHLLRFAVAEGRIYGAYVATCLVCGFSGLRLASRFAIVLSLLIPFLGIIAGEGIDESLALSPEEMAVLVALRLVVAVVCVAAYLLAKCLRDSVATQIARASTPQV